MIIFALLRTQTCTATLAKYLALVIIWFICTEGLVTWAPSVFDEATWWRVWAGGWRWFFWWRTRGVVRSLHKVVWDCWRCIDWRCQLNTRIRRLAAQQILLLLVMVKLLIVGRSCYLLLLGHISLNRVTLSWCTIASSLASIGRHSRWVLWHFNQLSLRL